jgi:hypothetical protein
MRLEDALIAADSAYKTLLYLIQECNETCTQIENVWTLADFLILSLKEKTSKMESAELHFRQTLSDLFWTQYPREPS